MDVKGVAVVGGARVLALLDSLLVALQAVLASLWQTVLVRAQNCTRRGRDFGC